MYITVKSVFNFLTNGINFLSFVCSVIIAFKISESSFTKFIPTGPNLDLLCVRQSDAALFCKNSAKLYFDVKH